jgi:glycosyltransferase involved in cell wall biosynthesis
MPKVSIIVPNYNHAKYLPERIDSILGQTFKDFELILMDDHSSDNSKQVLESYKSYPFVKLLFNDANSGSSFKQWNKGAKAATGEYIWIAESDDKADKDFLSTLVPVLDSDKTTSMVYTQSYDIDEEGKIRGIWEYHTKDFDDNIWANDFTMEGDEMIKKYMVYHNCLPNASGVLFRRDRMEEIGRADESFKLNGDWDFWIRMMMGTKVTFIHKPLNYFRTHAVSVRSESRKIGTGVYEYSRVLNFVFDKVPFTAQEKNALLKRFYNKVKWSPEFYEWKFESKVFEVLRKSYMMLPGGLLTFYLFSKHLLRRFCYTYIRMILIPVKRNTN